MKKSILRATSLLVLAALLMKPQLSFSGAKSGLLLWFDVVLPTLLPFMICSNLIVALDAVPWLIKPFKGFLKKSLKLSDPGIYIFITGLLCGYPMGAKTTADFIRNNRISRQEGNYLLAIANHPSPMFLAGYAYANMGGAIPLSHALLAIYVPILFLAYLARNVYHISSVQESAASDRQGISFSFDELLMSSLEVMVKIGGYIMLFSIFVAFTDLFLSDSFAPKAIFLGLIEMTTGISQIASRMTGPACAAAIIAVTAFGGLSGVAQTQTVIKNAGLSIRHYVAWKWLHAVLSCAVFILLQALLPLSR